MKKIIQYGCGKMSKYTMRYAYEKNMEIIGAFDISNDIIGSDIGLIMDSDNKNVIVEDSSLFESRLKELKPDCVIVTTMSLLNDVASVLLTCAKNGINAITTCEEAFYPFNSNPKLAKEIDALAKENNCTITGCGYQDVFWGNLITVLTGTTHKINKIIGSSSYNVEEYGIALAKAHGAGLSLDEFDKTIANADNISNEERQSIINDGNFLPSYMWNANGWLCDKLGLTVLSQTQKCVAQTNDSDITSSTLNMTIKKGMATGMSAKVITTTKEGITIESECIGKVYNDKEFDKNEWSIIGEPNTTVVINRPSTVELTCANVINRIKDVINSDSGFIPTSKFEISKY